MQSKASETTSNEFVGLHASACSLTPPDCTTRCGAASCQESYCPMLGCGRTAVCTCSDRIYLKPFECDTLMEPAGTLKRVPSSASSTPSSMNAFSTRPGTQACSLLLHTSTCWPSL